MTLGTWKRFQVDDYAMIVVLCFYTTLIATINVVRHTSSNLLPPGNDIDHLSQQEIDERTFGSKLILAVEQCQIATTWGAKTCLLIMYLRLTTLRREHIFIWCLIGYVAFGFSFMEIFYFGVWCRPFSNYWQVPTPDIQCNAATNHLITNAVFNLSSDCIMLAIGLPMFLRMQLPWKKKLPLIGIFSLGIFVVLAAVLNKMYSFTEPFGSLWTYWYVREASTALLVANLPFVWAFWRRLTGHKTVTGISGKGSRAPPEMLSRNGRSAKGRSDGVLPWDAYADIADEDLEMHEGPIKSAGLTLGDMLREDNRCTVTDQEEISPVTHPSLFFGKRCEGGPSKVPRAVVGQRSEQEIIRHNSGVDEAKAANTPGSSVFPSLNSEKSAGSFL